LNRAGLAAKERPLIDLSQPVLVVDDHKTMTRILDTMLRKCGFSNIDQVNDGQTAFERLQRQSYQFVLSDGEMPGMSGLDLVKKIRAEAQFKSIPFVLVSANTDAKYAEAAMAAGASAFLTKPFSVTTLQDVLKQLLRPA